MPKMKTNSSAKKRFALTGTGKIKRKHAFKNHILTKKKNTKDMNKILQCRLEQECINYLLYIINNNKKEYVCKSNSINILTCRIKNWFNRVLNLIWMLNSLEIKI